jgi:hypothetical protein
MNKIELLLLFVLLLNPWKVVNFPISNEALSLEQRVLAELNVRTETIETLVLTNAVTIHGECYMQYFPYSVIMLY